MKRLITRNRAVLAAILATCLLMLGMGAQPAQANHGAPVISAEAAALIDVESGRILYSKQGDKQMLIASLTKIMTTIVAIEEGDLSSTVKVGKNAYGKEGSSLYLHLGEEMNLEHMLYGIMLRSGNDAATAVAEHIGGSVDGFAYKMNEMAERLGMANSQFMNPHGLDADGHYSTANDMAKLTGYALKNDTFREIVKTKLKKVPNPNEAWDYAWRNKNKMLHLYEGGDGVKTGYTKAAGRCLVSSATRDGRQLAVVTLNAPSDWADHSRLLDYGFEEYPLRVLAEEDESAGDTTFIYEREFRYPLEHGETDRIRIRTELTEESNVDYRLGVRGYAEFFLGDEPIGRVRLIEAEEQASSARPKAASGSWLAEWGRLMEKIVTGS